MSETDRLRLTCPYCGGTSFRVSTRSEGQSFVSYDVPDEIECERFECDASWTADGTPSAAAKWVEWPGLYSKPA